MSLMYSLKLAHMKWLPRRMFVSVCLWKLKNVFVYTHIKWSFSPVLFGLFLCAWKRSHFILSLSTHFCDLLESKNLIYYFSFKLIFFTWLMNRLFRFLQFLNVLYDLDIMNTYRVNLLANWNRNKVKAMWQKNSSKSCIK